MTFAVGRNVRPVLEELVDPCLLAVRGASDVEVLYRPYFVAGWLSGSSRGPTPSGMFIYFVLLTTVYMLRCVCLVNIFSCLLSVVLPTPVVSRVDAVWNRRKRRILRDYYTGKKRGVCFLILFVMFTAFNCFAPDRFKIESFSCVVVPAMEPACAKENILLLKGS